MEASDLYRSLEKDFIKAGLKDDWTQNTSSIADFLTENFKQKSMGLVCDFADEINKVYAAVFPSNKVMQEVLDKGGENILLFVHHPAIWDIRKAPEVFQQMDRELLAKFKEKRVAIYNLHVPLDNFGEYSTSVSLAKSLNIKVDKPFGEYFGALCGVFGKTSDKNISDLKKRFESALGHESSLYEYGDNKIIGQKVAIVAGGGNNIEFLKEIAKENINLLITGITAKNSHSVEAHKFAEENKINILGGTHYSTEKFACIAMCDYFKKLRLPSEFIEDEPVLEDL
ncbi:MAG: Nif3-like dinuclear metal center hexameric protein [Candidatus Moraniibacteriota bacterium]